MIKTFAKFLFSCFVNALLYGIAGGIFFGFFGVVFWVMDGDPVGFLGLGAFGVVAGVLMGFGEMIIECAGRVPATARDPCRSINDENEREVIAAVVWAIENATPDDLQLLGQQLREWWAKHPSATRITGLEALMSGNYPLPDGPTPAVECPTDDAIEWPVPSLDGQKMYIPQPWMYCPALVWSSNAASSDVMNSLRRSIPSSIGNVGYSME